MSYLSGLLLPEIQGEVDLSVLTTRLNANIHNKTESQEFISFFIGIVDREKEKISYVNAGHNPPFLLDLPRLPSNPRQHRNVFGDVAFKPLRDEDCGASA